MQTKIIVYYDETIDVVRSFFLNVLLSYEVTSKTFSLLMIEDAVLFDFFHQQSSQTI